MIKIVPVLWDRVSRVQDKSDIITSQRIHMATDTCRQTGCDYLCDVADNVVVVVVVKCSCDTKRYIDFANVYVCVCVCMVNFCKNQSKMRLSTDAEFQIILRARRCVKLFSYNRKYTFKNAFSNFWQQININNLFDNFFPVKSEYGSI